MMKHDCLFFALVALLSACIGCATGVILFDVIAGASIVWAWVVYENEKKESEDD